MWRRSHRSLIRYYTTNNTTHPTHPINHATVIGAGLMGSGITQVLAQSGLTVNLIDSSSSALEKSRQIITKSLTRIAKKNFPDSVRSQSDLIDSTQAKITTSDHLDQVREETDLVIEAIVERLDIKQELFGRLDRLVRQDCIFASNTSSIKVSEIARSTSEDRQTRFAGLHFFNPVPQMKLVEIIRTKQTDDRVIESLTSLTKRIGKVPVNCLDTPGFIVNRLLVPYLLEAMRMLERGEATIEDIDTAMRLGTGYPMGPFELSDYVGLDTMKHISDGWRESGEIDNVGLVAPVKILDQLVADGKVGRKAGMGFKSYE